MSRERILIVSSRKEFISFCKVVFERDFDFFCVQTEEISFIRPEFFLVLAVLIDGSCFSCGESSYISKFFKNKI